MIAELLADKSVDEAVAGALAGFDAELTARGAANVEDDMAKEMIAENRAIIEALGRAWARVRLPQFNEEFEVVQINGFPYIEYESTVMLSPRVQLMVRPDCVARRREDGALMIFNWKTMSYVPLDWTENWDHSTPRLSEVLAVEHELSEEVESVVMEGMYIGAKRDNAHSTPLVWTWKCTPAAKANWKMNALEAVIYDFLAQTEGDVWYTWQIAELLSLDEEEVRANCRLPYAKLNRPEVTILAHEYRSAWEKVAAWELPGGVAHWIGALPPEVLTAQFIRTVPLMRDSERMASWRRQAVSKMTMTAASDAICRQSGNDPAVLDEHFAQNNEHCHRYSNSPCQFVPFCFKSSVAEQPFENGYVWRWPHHSTEEQV